MTKGKAKVNYLGRSGVVMPQTTPSWDFIYEVSTIRHPKYNIGDKVVLPDGRVFFYCKSSGLCDTYVANQFTNAIPATGIDWSVLAKGEIAGAKSVVMDNQGVVAQTVDGLRGGHINIGNDNNTVMQRGIIGNTAGGASDEITIYLDASLNRAVTIADYAYCMPSQYSGIAGAQYDGSGAASTGRKSFVGYAAASVTASGLYHWEQTWGPISASLYGAAVGKTQYMREVVFRYDGNLQHRSGASAAANGLECQTAGFIMDNNAADNGATIIMLKVAR